MKRCSTGSPPALKEAVTIRIPFPSEQAHVKIGQPFIAANHPDIYALRLGNNILGGSGFGSRLLEEIRVKRGLAYSANSRINTPKSTGVFAVSFQTQVEQADAAIATTRKVLREFVGVGPNEDEITQALDSIRTTVAFRTSSNGRLLAVTSNIAFHKREPSHLYDYVTKYEKENRDSITAAYQ